MTYNRLDSVPLVLSSKAKGTIYKLNYAYHASMRLSEASDMISIYQLENPGMMCKGEIDDSDVPF